jgi:hypothetical protein
MNYTNDFGIVLISHLSAKDESSEIGFLPVDYREGFMSVIKGGIQSLAQGVGRGLR